MRMTLALKRGLRFTTYPSLQNLKQEIPEIEIILDAEKSLIDIPDNKIDMLISLAAEYYSIATYNE